MLARTLRCLDLAVSHNFRIGNAIGPFQGPDETLDGRDLSRCRRSLFKVADQNDPNSRLVINWIRRLGMSAVQLLFPSKRRLNRAVFHPLPVPDHEVVADSEPGIAGAVFILQ